MRITHDSVHAVSAAILACCSLLPLACSSDGDGTPSDSTEATQSDLTTQIKSLAAKYEDVLRLDMSCQSEACTSCDAVAAPAGATGAKFCSSHGCSKKKAGWYYPSYSCASPDTACDEMTQRWLAMPATTTLVQSKCGAQFVVCAQGRQTTATVKDASAGSKSAGYFFEASYAVSAALGLPGTTIPNAVIYTNPADPQIALDPRCGACPPGQARCDGVCVDIHTNNAHCGACANACAAGMSCTNGSCACPAGTSNCGGSCVDTGSSDTNCGACGNVCPGGSSCQAGQCSCSGGATLCSASCVDTASDNANCGACGAACGADRVCVGGACACSAGLTQCGGACVDTSSDTANCGACGVECSSGKTCQGGACQCATGTSLCQGQCRTDCCQSGDGTASWDGQTQSWGWSCSQSPQPQGCFSCQHDAVCVRLGMSSIVCCPNGHYLSYDPNFTGDPLTLCPN
ncbi:MAG: hypothetical protein IT377_13660 [Polyangiaceae bacterium]|nr:hypothetical protein [Polyangiaceae bacterium]